MSFSLSMTTKAADIIPIDGFFPQFGQDAQWIVDPVTNELTYSGVFAPAPNASIATTFDGLVSDGAGNSDFTGLKLKFDAFIPSNSNLTIVLGYNSEWSGATGKGVFIEMNKWLTQGTKNFTYGTGGLPKWFVPNPPSDYQAVIKSDAYNTITINVDATGTVSVTVNGYVCPETYAAGVDELKAAIPSTLYALFAYGETSFKMKNLTATKGGVTNTYFSAPSAVKENKQNNMSVYPNPGKGVFTVTNEAVGQKYHINNILGQQVKTGLIISNKQLLDLTDEKAGTYMMVIDGVNGKTVKQIVKN